MVNEGAWAERVAVPTARARRAAGEGDLHSGATFPVAGLRRSTRSPRADRSSIAVCSSPAHGGVGDFAVQLARLAGAHVTATARRADQVAGLRALGAHEVTVGDEIPPHQSMT